MGGSDRALCAVPAVPADRAARQRGAVSMHRYSPTLVALPELTFDNYRKIADLYYLRLFARTLKLGVITTLICAVLGYPLAYWLARARPRLQAVGLFLLIMPLMVSAVIRIFGWIGCGSTISSTVERQSATLNVELMHAPIKARTARRKRCGLHRHTQYRLPRMTRPQPPLSRAICRTGLPNNRTTSGKCRTGRLSSKSTSGTWSAQCGDTETRTEAARTRRGV